LPLLVPQPGVPENVAVIVWLPTARLDSVKLAWPVASTGTAEAKVSVPSTKVTAPVGVPAPLPSSVTSAVTVTGWPKADGAGEVLTLVVVALWTTTGLAESLPLEAA
jgi:hypothetical protein